MTDTAKLRAIFRARVDALVDDLVDVLVDRVESTIGQALDAARSALESDLQRPRDAAPAAGLQWARCACGWQGLDTDAEEHFATHENDEPIGAEPSAAPAIRKRATMKCGKCGEVGYRADGCGRTHNISGGETAGAGRDQRGSTPPPSTAVDDDDDDDDEKTQSPPPSCVAQPVRRHRGSRAETRRRPSGAAVHLRHLIRSHACPSNN